MVNGIYSMIKVTITLILMSLSTLSFAAELIASVDRTSINENDRFVLQLKYTDRVGGKGPDLSALEKDFQIFNKQTSNQYRSINGRSESFTLWSINLMPKRLGKITIPSLSYRGASSQPINMTVEKLSQILKDKLAKEFFFDTKVDVPEGIIQGQIIYTEKLYYSVNHNDASLSDLKVTDALVVPLGEAKQYLTNINGVQHGVYERNYAIFPEQSGELFIPGTRFSANVPNPYNRWDPGRPVSTVAKPIQLQVASKPTNYPQSAWLPSRQLTVKDNWSHKINEWTVGEPVTRTITIKADGLSSSLLPSIALPIVKNLKYYPDQSNQSEDKTESGLTGKRVESIAIVPTKEGRFLLPEIRIPWWNIETQSVEYAVLPAITVDVNPATNAIATPNDPLSNPSDSGSATNTSLTGSHQNSGIWASGIWVIATLILLISNIITGFLLWRKHQVTEESAINTEKEKSSRQLYRALKASCKKNKPEEVRQALADWMQFHFNTTLLSELGSHIAENETDRRAINNLIAELDSMLYSPQANSAFNSQNLWMFFAKHYKKKSEQPKEETLQALY